MEIKIPRPVEGKDSTLEIKKPDSDTFGQAGDEAAKGKYAASMFRLLKGVIAGYDSDEIKKLPLKSSQFVTVEAFKLYNADTKVEGVYPCPRCGNILVRELGRDDDTRDDIASLDCSFWDGTDYADGFVKHTLREPLRFYRNPGREESLVFTVTGQTFRDITLGDMIAVENDASLSSDFSAQKSAMLRALVDVEGTAEEEGDWELGKLKTRWPRDLVRYPDNRDMTDILTGLQQWGYSPWVQRHCRKCGKEWEAVLQFESFFASALRSSSNGKEGASNGSRPRRNGRGGKSKG